MLKRADIRIRDPFILTDFNNRCYYMYGTTDLVEHSIAARCTFSVYKSYDLENFEQPKVIVDSKKLGFWGTKDFWAPEVHFYNGKYYLLGSCKSETMHRATQIFVCDTPDGEFVPLSSTARTPIDWECLDGTLYFENQTPYLVFSHEWTEVKNGQICALKLTDDLTATVGEPVLLFRASDNPMVSEIGEKGSGDFVTDGPFLFTENGKLKMIWSSFYKGRYQVLQAYSDSVVGKWEHAGPIFEFDGGHAMIFTNLDGKRMISLHAPNASDKERAQFFEI